VGTNWSCNNKGEILVSSNKKQREEMEKEEKAESNWTAVYK